MDIVLYLTALLKTRKMVGIAGLGTLYKKKSPGRYDSEKHAFVPPSYTLAFTTELKESEELAAYISEDRRISLDSANYFINEFADQILAKLADHHEAELSGIGTLKIEDGDLILVESEENSVSIETYGLPTLTDIQPEVVSEQNESYVADEEKLEAIEEENKIEEENPGSQPMIDDITSEERVYEEIGEVPSFQKSWDIERPASVPPIIETAEQEERVVQVVMVPPPPVVPPAIAFEETEEPKQGMSMLTKVLIVLAIILLAGAVAYFVNPKFFEQYIQNNHQEHPQSNVPIVPKDSLTRKKDSVEKKSAEKKDTVVAQPALPVVKDPNAIDSTKTYYEVIVASFKTKATADDHIKKLKKVGRKATVAEMPGKRFNISLGTFIEVERAYQLRDSLKSKNPGIYVQPITPKKHTN